MNPPNTPVSNSLPWPPSWASAYPAGRTGQRWDNALAESFFATIKRELLGIAAWPSRASARTAIFDFIEGPCCPIRASPS
ncbi:integrase core domain-containing protein [Streptomyces sp. NPDC056721]|uniref:integrase core domain-containing protein n=1 Tax=Streptomyces sp. NPDC056721 TaxID=3345923 RepID=UPI0036AC3333